jgi:hypothetical protein
LDAGNIAWIAAANDGLVAVDIGDLALSSDWAIYYRPRLQRTGVYGGTSAVRPSGCRTRKSGSVTQPMSRNREGRGVGGKKDHIYLHLAATPTVAASTA